jgi:hypothetical protein
MSASIFDLSICLSGRQKEKRENLRFSQRRTASWPTEGGVKYINNALPEREFGSSLVTSCQGSQGKKSSNPLARSWGS